MYTVRKKGIHFGLVEYKWYKSPHVDVFQSLDDLWLYLIE